MTPDGYAEELALERLALRELEAEATRAWEAGAYGHARQSAAEAREARRHIEELESTLTPPPPAGAS